MRCVFVVQGEGRGHMTQALALSRFLQNAGHEVVAALVGRSSRRELPDFFIEKIGAPVRPFESPNFVTDSANRSVRVAASLAATARSASVYLASLKLIGTALEEFSPDLVVNFFEPLAGIYYARRRPSTPMVCIAHQYLVHHASYPFPPRSTVNRHSLQLFADITALGAAARLSLSFRPIEGAATRKMEVVPPLLRPELLEQPRDRAEPFVLAYVLNSGYAPELIRRHSELSDTVVHCFWDKSDAPDEWSPAPSLTFHRLNDRKFLDMMSRCSGLVCTAGFESICEAMYLGKPVMMVPVEGHFEQACNALDAVSAGAGVSSTAFEIDRLLSYIPTHAAPPFDFRAWVDSAPDRFIRALEAVADARA